MSLARRTRSAAAALALAAGLAPAAFAQAPDEIQKAVNAAYESTRT